MAGENHGACFEGNDCVGMGGGIVKKLADFSASVDKCSNTLPKVFQFKQTKQLERFILKFGMQRIEK